MTSEFDVLSVDVDIELQSINTDNQSFSGSWQGIVIRLLILIIRILMYIASRTYRG